MKRLLVHVEGQTEEQFVNEILAPHLYARGFEAVGARVIGNARQRARRGGIVSWRAARRGIALHLRRDSKSAATTMVDYYGLPETWPGRAEASGGAADKARIIENALLADLSRKMGAKFDPARFVPYIAMHEFEAMLFSDCERFGRGVGHASSTPKFQAIRDSFATPEEIDDSPDTAPSRRIEKLIPGYRKPLSGTLAAQAIGLPRIRSECPHVSDWLDRLESLP